MKGSYKPEPHLTNWDGCISWMLCEPSPCGQQLVSTNLPQSHQRVTQASSISTIKAKMWPLLFLWKVGNAREEMAVCLVSVQAHFCIVVHVGCNWIQSGKYQPLCGLATWMCQSACQNAVQRTIWVDWMAFCLASVVWCTLSIRKE